MASPESIAGSGSGNTVTWSKIPENEEESICYLKWIVKHDHNRPSGFHPNLIDVDQARNLLDENENGNVSHVRVDHCLMVCKDCKHMYRIADGFPFFLKAQMRVPKNEEVTQMAYKIGQCNECFVVHRWLTDAGGADMPQLRAKVAKSFDRPRSDDLTKKALFFHRNDALFEHPDDPTIKFHYRCRGWCEIFQLLYHFIRQEVANEWPELLLRDGSIRNVCFTAESAIRIQKKFLKGLQQTESLWNVFESKTSPAGDDFRSIVSMKLVDSFRCLFQYLEDHRMVSGGVMQNVTVSFLQPPLFTNFIPRTFCRQFYRPAESIDHEMHTSFPSRFETHALQWMAKFLEKNAKRQHYIDSFPEKQYFTKSLDLLASIRVDAENVFNPLLSLEIEVLHQLMHHHKNYMHFRVYLGGIDDFSDDFVAVGTGVVTVAYGSDWLLKHLFRDSLGHYKCNPRMVEEYARFCFANIPQDAVGVDPDQDSVHFRVHATETSGKGDNNDRNDMDIQHDSTNQDGSDVQDGCVHKNNINTNTRSSSSSKNKEHKINGRDKNLAEDNNDNRRKNGRNANNQGGCGFGEGEDDGYNDVDQDDDKEEEENHSTSVFRGLQMASSFEPQNSEDQWEGISSLTDINVDFDDMDPCDVHHRSSNNNYKTEDEKGRRRKTDKGDANERNEERTNTFGKGPEESSKMAVSLEASVPPESTGAAATSLPETANLLAKRPLEEDHGKTSQNTDRAGVNFHRRRNAVSSTSSLKDEDVEQEKIKETDDHKHDNNDNNNGDNTNAGCNDQLETMEEREKKQGEIQLTEEEEQRLELEYVDFSSTHKVEESNPRNLGCSLLEALNLPQLFTRRTMISLEDDSELRELREFVDAAGLSARDLITKPILELGRHFAIFMKCRNPTSYQHMFSFLFGRVNRMRDLVTEEWFEMSIEKIRIEKRPRNQNLELGASQDKKLSAAAGKFKADLATKQAKADWQLSDHTKAKISRGDNKHILREAMELARQKAISCIWPADLRFGQGTHTLVYGDYQDESTSTIWIEAETTDGIRISQSKSCDSVIFSLESIVLFFMREYGLETIARTDHAFIGRHTVGRFLCGRLRKHYRCPSMDNIPKVLCELAFDVEKQKCCSKLDVLTRDEGCYLVEVKLVKSPQRTQWICYLAKEKMLFTNEAGGKPWVIKEGIDALKNDDTLITSPAHALRVRKMIADTFFKIVLKGWAHEITSWYTVSPCESWFKINKVSPS